MGQKLGGQGILLPPPQNYYPSQLFNAPQDPSSNVMTLAGGDTFCVPAGNFYVDLGGPLVLQFLDPVNGIWEVPRTGGNGFEGTWSDGENFRVANLTGCLVAAVVTNQGSGYAQATTTVVSSAGGSTWQPIVGGQLSVASTTAKGGNYGVAPILMIPPPPSPGVQATGFTTIGTGGTISGVTLDNVGAGYKAAPLAVVVPSPFDPNLSAGITQGAILLGVIGAGSISAILCTNPGAPVATTGVSLTIAGAGTAATATPVQMLTLTGATVFSAGAGYTGGQAALQTVGGVPTAVPVVTNPLIEGRAFGPRPASALLAGAGTSLSSVSAVYDGGLFLGTPGVIISPFGGSLITTSASVVGIYGTAPGTMRMTPAP
jgi:hypothetical protein